ncbi:hypothetical protein [Neobacillus mesonae]|nr:hypothetical protein [Neobacillus mesonae]
MKRRKNRERGRVEGVYATEEPEKLGAGSHRRCIYDRSGEKIVSWVV